MASSGNIGWNNQQDYRERVRLADLVNGQKDWQKVAKSVGAFVGSDSLVPTDRNDPRKGYRFRNNSTLRSFVRAFAPNAAMDDYRFWDDNLPASMATCYYIGDGIVATASHLLDKLGDANAVVLEKHLIVFGTVEDYCSGAEQRLVSADNIFVFERILYKQYNNGEAPTHDYCDWALLRIRPLHPEIEPAQFPPALRVMAPKASYQPLEVTPDIFALGHPWGLALRLGDVKEANVIRQRASPPKAPLPARELFTTFRRADNGVDIPLLYSFRHNNINHSGNSGGPLFMRSTNVNEAPTVIATTVANGTVPRAANPSGMPDWLGLFQWKREGYVFGDRTQPGALRINMPTAERWTYNIATKTSMWHNLINPQANITTVFTFNPAAGATGYLRLLLHVMIPSIYNDIILRFTLYSTAINDATRPVPGTKIRVTKKFIDIVRSAQSSGDNVFRLKPAYIVGVEANFTVAENGDESATAAVRGDAELGLITMIARADPRVDPLSDVVMLRRTKQDVNVLIERPRTIDNAWRDAAQADEQGVTDM